MKTCSPSTPGSPCSTPTTVWRTDRLKAVRAHVLEWARDTGRRLRLLSPGGEDDRELARAVLPRTTPSPATKPRAARRPRRLTR